MYMEKLINVAIVEDSAIDQEILSGFVKQFFFEKDINVNIDIFPNGKSILDFEGDFDLLFLDMYLPDLIGVKLLEELRNKGVKSPVIFSTMSKDFIEQSYEADALHYMLKPLTFEKVSNVLTKFLNNSQSLQTVTVKIGRDKENFLVSNIEYIESFSHKCIMHIGKEEIEISETIGDITEKFEKFDFIKVNRTTIVNMKYIKDVTSTDVILENNMYVSISRNNKSEIKSKISTYRNSK